MNQVTQCDVGVSCSQRSYSNGTRAVLHIPVLVSSLFPVLFLHVPFVYLYTRQMLSIMASGSDATVVNGFLHSALEVVRELS